MIDESSRRLWMLCVLFGAAVIGFAVWFAGAIPLETCSGPLPAGVSSLLALAAVCFCAGVAMLRRRNLLGRIGGAACIAGGIMGVIGLAAEPARGALSAGGGVAWLAMLAYAAVASAHRA